MAVPNSSYLEIASVTIDNYRETLADNVLTHNMLLLRMKQKGNTDPASGGVNLLENLMYQQTQTFKWYSGYETLDTSASDVITVANFTWKQANCNVTFSGLEQMQNNGKQQIINLVKSRILVAEKTMQNSIASALFFSNTENAGKSIGGLQFLVADLPTSGVVGNIDSSVWTFWRNQYYSFTTESVTAGATTMLHAVNRTWLRCLRGTDKPDLAVAGETYFNYFEEGLQAQQRFMATTKGEAGFETYKYKGMDVIYDVNCSATRFYLLNTDYLHFRPHADRNFVTMDRRQAINQDATLIPIMWAGNMTVSNRSLQGIIKS